MYFSIKAKINNAKPQLLLYQPNSSPARDPEFPVLGGGLPGFYS